MKNSQELTEERTVDIGLALRRRRKERKMGLIRYKETVRSGEYRDLQS